eukprot:3975021-Amphidinium_carterae.1
MPGLEVLRDGGVPLQCRGFSPLDLETAAVPCLETEGLDGSTVPTVPSLVNVPLLESSAPTLPLGAPRSRPYLGWVIRHRRWRLDLLSE